jgi:hypothetical protein
MPFSFLARKPHHFFRSAVATMDLYCHASDKGKHRAITRLAELIRG